MPEAERSVCYRHPAVESYVLCQRWSRPICPSCQREAAVGVQCPECVTAGAGRPTRSAFGARLRDGRPVVTLTLIALSVLIFVLQLTPVRIGGVGVTDLLGYLELVARNEPWRWLTYSLVHSPSLSFGILHLGLNMYGLYLVGPYLEQQFGRIGFLVVWLLSVLGGAVVFAALVPADGGATMVGASGGVFGLFGAWFIAHRRLGRDTSQVAGIIIINVLFGFLVSGIAWQGHLGGLLAGAAATAVLAYAPADRPVLKIAGLALVGILLVVAAWLVAPQSPFRVFPAVSAQQSPAACQTFVHSCGQRWGEVTQV